jgi:hypothetical protein
MLLRGLLLLVALVWLALPKTTPLVDWLKKPAVVLTIAILALAGFWLPTVLYGYSTTIGGTRYWWLVDDMMITMRYGKNLAHGYGLVWNPGEYVEGYTNFLWALYMGVLHLFPIPLSKTSLVVSLTNILLSAATIPLLLAIVRMLNGRTMAVVATLAAYALSLNIKNWAVAGTETSLLAFFIALAIYRMFRDTQQQHPSLLTYLIIGLVALVRSDGLVLAVMLCGISVLLHRGRWHIAARYVVIALLFPAAHMLFRYFYYGDIIPNTAYLKVLNWGGRYEHGIQYVLSFISDYIFIIIVAAIGSLVSRSPRQLLLAGMILAYMGYIAYAGGDAFVQYRFLVPVLPILFVLAFVGIQHIVTRHAARLLITMLCLISIPLLIPARVQMMYPREDYIGNVKLGLILKHNVPEDSTVADFWAGTAFYFSDAYGIDLLGKNDPYIARLPAIHGNIPGHNKYDFDYSLGNLKPDFVIVPFSLSEWSEEKMREIAETIPWRTEIYFHPTFREHCLPYPVPVDTWRTIFVCDWSPYVDDRDAWVVPFSRTR